MRDFQPLNNWLAELVTPFEDDAFIARYRENIEHLFALAVLLFHKAASVLPDAPGEDVPINALGISLQPDRWKKDGLFRQGSPSGRLERSCPESRSSSWRSRERSCMQAELRSTLAIASADQLGTVVRTPIRAPTTNAVAERSSAPLAPNVWIGSSSSTDGSSRERSASSSSTTTATARIAR